ncbi:MAG: glycosyltransferase [Candidatus Kerfeldbacteria bacterium]|nr:glycosyltransferase [Candidatus Kerfeldbacteria bacterium]
MKRRDCILLNMSRARDWERGVVNRNYYIANELARSAQIRQILSVDLLPHSLRRATKMFFQDIQRPAFERLIVHEPGRSYHLTTIMPILNERLFVRRLTSSVRTLGFENPVLWSYLPTYVGVFRAFPSALKVFDAVDDWSAHPAYRTLKEKLSQNYDIIRRSADVIFTVSEQLQAKFAPHPRTYWVPNGIDLERFQQPRTRPGRPCLIYVGVVQERVDLGLLERLARARPNYDVVIVGPVWRGINVDGLRQLPNVRFTGFVAASQVPKLLSHATVGLVPHRQSQFVASMNPMKIYEYLAAGLPVVATHLKGFERFSAAVSTTASSEEFLQAVDTAVAAAPDPERSRRLVAEHTWSSRFATMWRHLHAVL